MHRRQSGRGPDSKLFMSILNQDLFVGESYDSLSHIRGGGRGTRVQHWLHSQIPPESTASPILPPGLDLLMSRKHWVSQTIQCNIGDSSGNGVCPMSYIQTEDNQPRAPPPPTTSKSVGTYARKPQLTEPHEGENIQYSNLMSDRNPEDGSDIPSQRRSQRVSVMR